MRYMLKQDVLAWGDDFDILDESGATAYVVDGHGFSLMNKLSFQDSRGQELASIRQVPFSWGSQYDLYRSGKLAARVSQQTLSKAKCTFVVDGPGPDDLEATGDFYNHAYEFRRGRRTVAAVSRSSEERGFVVDVTAGEDQVLILASAIVIDLVSHEGSNEGSLYK